MKNIAFLLAIFVISSFCFGAQVSGWDKSSWGMSGETIASIYRAEIKASAMGNLEFEKVIDGNKFSIQFKLEDDKLCAVLLSLYDATTDNYLSTKEKLVKKYGAPAVKNSDYAIWSLGQTSIKLTAPITESPIPVMLVYYERVSPSF